MLLLTFKGTPFLFIRSSWTFSQIIVLAIGIVLEDAEKKIQKLKIRNILIYIFKIYKLAHKNYLQLLQNATTASSVMQPLNNAGKRYKCDHCNYGTDRRDLFTRHESIHKDDKPFQCEVCKKPFNRADHVKKHHERMHKEQLYDPSKIRVRGKDQDSSQTQQASVGNASGQQQPHINYQPDFSANKGYQLQPNAVASSSGTGAMSMYQAPAMPAPDIMQATANNCNNTVRRVPNSGCNSKSHFKGSSKSTQDRR